MPFFFAGKLESGNVCEYFVMLRHFHTLGIHDHDAMLYEMGMKEKEHEGYFLGQIRKSLAGLVVLAHAELLFARATPAAARSPVSGIRFPQST